MDIVSGAATHTAYTIGTQAWANAVRYDYEKGLITADQMATLFKGYVDPATGQLVPQQPGFLAGVLSGLGDIGNVLMTSYAKLQQLELQKAQQEYQIQAAKNALVGGVAGEGLVPSWGGLNIYTLAAFAGIGLMFILIMRK